MLDIKIIAIGKIKNKNLEQICQEYLVRIKPFAKINIVELEAEKFSSNSKTKAKEMEGRRISSIITGLKNSYIIFLEEQGANYSSIEFARKLEGINKKIVLVIGGSLGIDKNIKIKPDLIISLSRLTFSHELARTILFEQLYRATTIINNKEYHY